MKILPKILLLSALVVISFLSNGQVPSASTLSNKDKQNSLQFKSLKGQDRVAVFHQLQNLIRVKQTNGTNSTFASNRMGAKPCNETDLTELLGVPDKKIGTTLIIYFLKTTNSGCKAVIGVDKDGDVIFCTIKDCN